MNLLTFYVNPKKKPFCWLLTMVSSEIRIQALIIALSAGDCETAFPSDDFAWCGVGGSGGGVASITVGVTRGVAVGVFAWELGAESPRGGTCDEDMEMVRYASFSLSKRLVRTCVVYFPSIECSMRGNGSAICPIGIYIVDRLIGHSRYTMTQISQIWVAILDYLKLNESKSALCGIPFHPTELK